jgi:uncharacterized Tic20 family protein
MVGMDQDTPDTPADTPETDPAPNAADGAPEGAKPPMIGGGGPAPIFETTPEERTWGMLCHLLGIVLGFVGPLIMWLIKKDESPFVDDQGKEALNFQITVLIAMIVSSALMFIIIGCVLVPLLAIANIVFIVIASMAANRGETYRYPFAIRIIK